MTANQTLSERVDRLEEIIERLENDDVSLEEAKQLHEEGLNLLEKLRGQLDVGDGTVIEE